MLYIKTSFLLLIRSNNITFPCHRPHKTKLCFLFTIINNILSKDMVNFDNLHHSSQQWMTCLKCHKRINSSHHQPWENFAIIWKILLKFSKENYQMQDLFFHQVERHGIFSFRRFYNLLLQYIEVLLENTCHVPQN